MGKRNKIIPPIKKYPGKFYFSRVFILLHYENIFLDHFFLLFRSSGIDSDQGTSSSICFS